MADLVQRDESQAPPKPTKRPAAPKPESVAMPDEMIVRVRTRRGIGHIIRVREDPVRPFYIRLETGGDEFWAVMEHIQPIGFTKAVVFKG